MQLLDNSEKWKFAGSPSFLILFILPLLLVYRITNR
ncbi:GlyGly-CTERM sorting domain-containing protein [Gelidibacter japonicus]